MSAPNQNNHHHDQRDTKIFVGGLAWRTTTDDLRGFFQQNFGEVLHANVVLEPSPGGRSKGYGFVTFRDVEAAARACEPPHPIIDGRQTNINLAYLRAKKNNNNTNQSNQNGVTHQAGPSHQYQNGLLRQAGPSHQYQNGSFNQAGPSLQYQHPYLQYNPHFPQFYWDANCGQYCYTSYNNFPCYPYSPMVPHNVSAYVMQPNWHQMTNRPRVIISKPKNSSPILKIEEIKETIQDKDQESDTEPDSDVDDQQKGKDQEGGSFGNDDGITLDVEYQNGETSGQDKGIGQDVEYQNGKTSGQDNGITLDVEYQNGETSGQDKGIGQDVEYQNGKTSGQDNGIKQDVEDQNGETSGQDNGINTQQIVVVLDDENENRKGLITESNGENWTEHEE